MTNDPALDSESVWDYPRPPRLESTSVRIRVVHGGQIIADSSLSDAPVLRILETSHPPVYYLSPKAVSMHLLKPSLKQRSYCEFKGLASYWSVSAPGHEAHDAAWSYEAPTAAYAALGGHLAFYANLVDECWVGEERVVPQPGDFYGGWITSNLRGPFKGAPGTRFW